MHFTDAPVCLQVMIARLVLSLQPPSLAVGQIVAHECQHVVEYDLALVEAAGRHDRLGMGHHQRPIESSATDARNQSAFAVAPRHRQASIAVGRETNPE